MTAYRNASHALVALAAETMKGNLVPSRNGDTRELTMTQFTITNPLDREPIVEGRKHSLAALVAETMWVLSGRNDVEWLSHYLPRAKDFSDDGETWRAGYGPRLRSWQPWQEDAAHATDQLAEVVRLLREDPGTRRAVMSIFDPALDYVETKDVPCNNWLHFLYRDGELHLHVVIRSNDLIWGWSGINQFEWSVLLELVAALTGMRVGTITYSISSLHVYEHHWDKATVLGAKRFKTHVEPQSATRFASQLFDFEVSDWDELCRRWFAVEHLIRQTDTKVDLDRLITDFPEPMLRQWLYVIAYYWSGDARWLAAVDQRTHLSVRLGVQPKRFAADKVDASKIKVTREQLGMGSEFLDAVIALHDQKHAAYGDSWKRRGELFSIIPNIARKVDRLGGGETDDETQTDTAIDLLVYLAKYYAWLNGDANSNGTGMTSAVLRHTERRVQSAFIDWPEPAILEQQLKVGFEGLISDVEEGHRESATPRVRSMLDSAYVLARGRWTK